MKYFYLVAIVFLVFSGSVHADYPPVKKHGTDKWRVAYLEGGAYYDYQLIFKQILRSLMKRGWIENQKIPDEYFKEHRKFWVWVTQNLKTEFLEFLPDGFYSSDFDQEKRIRVKQHLKDRITTENDIDFIFAMGTWAGQDMADAAMHVPTEVASTSDPIGSGIVKSVDDSGFDHLHAKIEPDRYKKQLKIFYDLVGFKRLGFIMEDSPEGRTYSAYSQIAELSQEAGFKMVICNARFSGVSQADAESNAVTCYKDLSDEVDAVYVTVHRGVVDGNMAKIVKTLTDNGVPSFSQRGENEVEKGALMSISQANFSYAADFHARAISRIFHGETPGSIPMVWNAPAKITINLETADRIGWFPPYAILKAADRLYDNIPE